MIGERVNDGLGGGEREVWEWMVEKRGGEERTRKQQSESKL